MSSCGSRSGSGDAPISTEKVLNPARWVKYEAITIPGLKEPYLGCGEIFKILTCPSCDYKRPIMNTCDRPDCSECWGSWAAKEATRSVERFNGYKQAYKEWRNKRLGNVRHIILSPPQEMARKMVSEPGGIDKLKKKAIYQAKKHNLYGGSVVYHHYRILKKYKAVLKDLAHARKRKLWDLIREDELGIGSWRDYVYIAPHFHMVVFGGKVNGNEFYEETGWILKSKGYISKNEKLHNAIFYQLSHVAIRDGKRALTWFGSLSYNKLSRSEKSINYEIMKCPVCGADLKSEDVKTGNREEAIAKVITYRYFINKPPRLKVQTPLEGWK